MGLGSGDAMSGIVVDGVWMDQRVRWLAGDNKHGGVVRVVMWHVHERHVWVGYFGSVSGHWLLGLLWQTVGDVVWHLVMGDGCTGVFLQYEQVPVAGCLVTD